MKLIPQLFFDLIGRVVPGGVAIALILCYSETALSNWTEFMRNSLGLPGKQELPSSYVLFTLLFFAFVVGHVLSPFTKLAEWVGQHYPPGKPKPDSRKYEWLRVNNPDAGALCAKLRAEFTMYNALGAVFFLSAVTLGFLKSAPNLLHILGFLLLSILMIYRGRETRQTFANSVALLHLAASERPPAPHVPFKKAKK